VVHPKLLICLQIQVWVYHEEKAGGTPVSPALAGFRGRCTICTG